MIRWRALGALIVLATAVSFVPGAPASAASPLTVTITCDARTGAIATSTAGQLLVPGSPTGVRVEFERRIAYRVTADGVSHLPLTAPFVVSATTNSAGEIAATGYTGTFDPVGSLFYREQVVVTYRNAATGSYYTERVASCFHDQRHTVTLTCDPAAGTVTATVTGIKGDVGGTNRSGWASRVGYHRVRTSQPTATAPGFRTELLNGAYDVEHPITRAADGTWADTGFVQTVQLDTYYYAEELTVGIHDSYGTMVGSGTARCVLFNGGNGANGSNGSNGANRSNGAPA